MAVTGVESGVELTQPLSDDLVCQLRQIMVDPVADRKFERMVRRVNEDLLVSLDGADLGFTVQDQERGSPLPERLRIRHEHSRSH
jgi:hypothetical protein